MLIRHLAAIALAALIAAVVLDVISPLEAIANAIGSVVSRSNSDPVTGYIINPRQ